MNYAAQCISMHKPGDPAPIVQNGQLGVLYDGTMYIYEIPTSEVEGFKSWAIATWADVHDADANAIEDRAQHYGRILYLD